MASVSRISRPSHLLPTPSDDDDDDDVSGIPATVRTYQSSSVQFIDSMQQLHHDIMIAQIRTWKRT